MEVVEHDQEVLEVGTQLGEDPRVGFGFIMGRSGGVDVVPVEEEVDLVIHRKPALLATPADELSGALKMDARRKFVTKPIFCCAKRQDGDEISFIYKPIAIDGLFEHVLC